MNLLNNSHYRVDLAYSVNAEGGSNPGGKTVKILKKRTRQEIEIPLSVWNDITERVDRGLQRQLRIRSLIRQVRGCAPRDEHGRSAEEE